MSEDRLTRDDLVLLMESYRNMITMHQAILSQTSKTIERMDNIANKQDSLFSKQGQICNSLQSITTSLDDVTVNLKTCTSEIDSLDNNVVNKLNEHEKRTIENHGKIINKIYLGWIGMGTIILGLIGLVIALANFLKSIPLS